MAARIALLAALCSVAVGQAIAQNAPEFRQLRSGLEALVSCAELEFVKQAALGASLVQVCAHRGSRVPDRNTVTRVSPRRMSYDAFWRGHLISAV